MQLELGIHPDDAVRLPRLALLAPLRNGKARSRAVRIVWHDSADRALARQGLALAEQRPQWRLERLTPNSQTWAPGTPSPVVARARSTAALGQVLPDPLVPVAALEGRTVGIGLATELGPVAMTLLNAAVRAVASETRVSRVRLEGSPPAVAYIAVTLAGELRLTVPRASLPAEAAAVASGTVPPPRHEGAPELPAGVSVTEAFAHVVGHLTDVILYYAPKAALGAEGPEPVHQMRVAVRRLRSAIKVFGQAVGCPEVDAADEGLRALAAKLAPTRDWDVFATETARSIAQAFPEDPRLRRLLGAVERRRNTCHRELRCFLEGAEFRRLGVELACLAATPMSAEATDDTERPEPAPELGTFAGDVLSKRLKRLVHVDEDLARLEPAALHAIRLRAKRMRYAAEIFAPLYPGKATHRFLRRLSRLQDQLGTLNDAAVAAGLLGQITGGSHAFATGLILGFVGARNRETREGIDKAWDRFRRLEPFWQ